MHFQVFLEPLKKAQVEGFLMFAEPEVLFGNLDELCSVRLITLFLTLECTMFHFLRSPIRFAKNFSRDS